MQNLENKVVTYITLHTDTATQNRPMYIYAKQYDYNSRYIVVRIADSNKTIPITGSVQLNATKPDGNHSYISGSVNEDGTVTIGLTPNLLAVEGKISCDITVFDSDNNDQVLLTTSTFFIIVDKSNYDIDAIESTNEFPIHCALVDELKNILQPSIGSGYPSEPSGYIGKTYIDTDTGDVYIETPRNESSPDFHAISFSADIDKKLNKKMDSVDYTYLPKYRFGAAYILHFGGFSESSTEYQIAHLSEAIDPSAAYFVAKDGKETYIQPKLITAELKTKYHVSSGMGNDARYYIPITDELIVLEYYISPTEAYYYLHTSADSIELVEEVYVGKAQKLIDDSYASHYNLWSAQKTKDCVDTKLDKITTTGSYNRVYGVSYAGNQTTFSVASEPVPSAIAQRDSYGNIKTGTPVEDGDATPKSYVDEIVDDSTTDAGHAWSGGRVNNALNGMSQTIQAMGTGLTQAINAKADKGSVDAIKPIVGITLDPDNTTDAKFLGRLYIKEATGEMFYAARSISDESYEWRSIVPEVTKQSANPNTEGTVGYLGQLCLVGSSDFSPYDVYICVMSDHTKNMYFWHKMCTTEAPM